MSNDLVNRLRRIGERIPIPCPEGIRGCLAFHFRVETNPVCAKAADRIEALERALRDCVEDLEAEIAYRYTSVLQYPAMKSKYELDMEPVARARALLGDTKENQS